MNTDSPIVVVIAGPNGAGKSTVAPRIIEQTFGRIEFVNADVIASGLSVIDPDRQAFAAGRFMLRHVHSLANARRSFAFETTLASRTFAAFLRRLLREGYQTHLIYIWVRTPETAVERVRARVSSGGHSIPEETIQRRFRRSAHNLFDLYLPLAHGWEILDNSTASNPTLIAAGSGDEEADMIIHDEMAWSQLRSFRHAL